MRERNAELIAAIVGPEPFVSAPEIERILGTFFVTPTRQLLSAVGTEEDSEVFSTDALKTLLTQAANGEGRNPVARQIRPMVIATLSNLKRTIIRRLQKARNTSAEHARTSEPGIEIAGEEEEEEEEGGEPSSYDEDEEPLPGKSAEIEPEFRSKPVSGEQYLPAFYDWIPCYSSSPRRYPS
jgi:hypothetical protein